MFPGKWIFDYEYEGKLGTVLQLPDRIVISTDHNGEAGSRVNTYHLVGVKEGGTAIYEGKKGGRRSIDLSYFEIAPSPIGMPTPFGRF